MGRGGVTTAGAGAGAEVDNSGSELPALVRPSWPPPIVELLPPRAKSPASWFNGSRISSPVGIAGSKDGCLVPLGDIACSYLKSAFCLLLTRALLQTSDLGSTKVGCDCDE